jgi:hypothetical protein
MEARAATCQGYNKLSTSALFASQASEGVVGTWAPCRVDKRRSSSRNLGIPIQL